VSSEEDTSPAVDAVPPRLSSSRFVCLRCLVFLVEAAGGSSSSSSRLWVWVAAVLRDKRRVVDHNRNSSWSEAFVLGDESSSWLLFRVGAVRRE
jgi:hypothetical protein